MKYMTALFAKAFLTCCNFLKMNKALILIPFLLGFNACRNSKSENKTIENNAQHKPATLKETSESEADLIKNIIYKGDTIAYNALSCDFFMQNKREEFFYYALIMANKYGYSEAYFHMYHLIVHPNTGQSFNELDEKSKNLAMYFFLKSGGKKSTMDENLVGFFNKNKQEINPAYYLYNFGK